MRRKDLERRQVLLECAQKIECAEGVDAINIRRLATEAKIAVGTVYNYFESKDDVLFALTEAYWKNALFELRDCLTAKRFSGQAVQLLAYLRSKMTDCGEILMKSMHDNPDSGRARMTTMQKELKRLLLELLRSDETVRSDVWSERFTQEAFADFVLMNLLALLQQKNGDTGVFLEVINRILYEGSMYDTGTD